MPISPILKGTIFQKLVLAFRKAETAYGGFHISNEGVMFLFFHPEIKMLADPQNSNLESVYIYGKKVFGPAPRAEAVDYVARYLRMGDYCDLTEPPIIPPPEE